jgi:hypothetical protein
MPLSLASLSVASLEGLEAQYARGAPSRSLEVLEGFAPGRLLRLTGPAGREPMASMLRYVTGSPSFPWRGKRFEIHSRGHGEGINRFGRARRRERYRFQVTFDASALDGLGCVRLDYDVPGNPRWLRRAHAELREVAPGLLLGPGCVTVVGVARPVVYVALSLRALGAHRLV